MIQTSISALPLPNPGRLVEPNPCIVPMMAPCQQPPPQLGIPAPTTLMPIRHLPQAGLWIVGAHGGSGESVIAGLDPQWEAASHCFPDEGNLLVCCTTSAYGLERGRMALQQHMSGFAGRGRLIGLALVANTPGKTPKELRRLKGIVQSLAPATVEIPFDKSLRLEPYPPNDSDRFSRQHSIIDFLNRN